MTQQIYSVHAIFNVPTRSENKTFYIRVYPNHKEHKQIFPPNLLQFALTPTIPPPFLCPNGIDPLNTASVDLATQWNYLSINEPLQENEKRDSRWCIKLQGTKSNSVKEFFRISTLSTVYLENLVETNNSTLQWSDLIFSTQYIISHNLKGACCSFKWWIRNSSRHISNHNILGKAHGRH